MKTIAEQLNHDFEKGSLRFYDTNGNEIYYEDSNGFWSKREYDTDGNKIYHEYSNGYWYKYEYDTNGKEIYYENSDEYWYKKEYDTNGKVTYYENSYGKLIDNRPKPSYEGKVVEIDGKKYRLKEIG